MRTSDVSEAAKAEFRKRKYSAGLLVAMIDLFAALDVPRLRAASFAEVLQSHPRHEKLGDGRTANTLILEKTDGGTLGLRPFYDAVERCFHADHKRFDYPSCAPHATQAWGDYMHWLNALATFTREELKDLRAEVTSFVLETLPSHEFDPATVEVAAPIFRLVLEEFDLSKHKGEKTGAAYQGVVFGFIRADNPHLQVEVDKVRTGSTRKQRVGDIDAWDGERLAITAEVKQYTILTEDVPSLEKFASEATRRGAIGLVVALDFGEGVRDAIEGIGARPVSIEGLVNAVSLWDPRKQENALAALQYYVRHVERNKSLELRIKAFLESVAKDSETPV